MAEKKKRKPKSRGNGEGSIYRRESDGLWVAQICVGRKPNGGLKYRAVYGKTREAVKEKLLDLQSSRKAGSYCEPNKTTMSQWLDTWLKEYKKGELRKTTYASYEQHIRLHLKPGLGHYLLQDLKSLDVQKFYNEKYNEGKGLSARTVRYLHVILSQALDAAIANNLIPCNVCADKRVKPPKGEQPEKQVFSVDDELKFIEAAKNDRMGTAFILMLYTGLRRGECLALRWQDVDLKEGIINVNQSVCRVKVFDDPERKTALIWDKPKTKSGMRAIPAEEPTIKMLEAHQLKQKEELLKIGLKVKPETLVFTTELGTPIEPRNFVRSFYKIRDKAGLPKISIHGLRHTFATRLMENGTHIKTASELLGHAKTDITLQVYQHVMPETKKVAISSLHKLHEKKAASSEE